MFVKDLIQSFEIYTVLRDTTVREAAFIMAELKVGALIVGSSKKLEGIFTERDILKRVIGKNLSVEHTKIKDVMSTNIIVIEENEMAHIALKIMQERNFRHLPVVNEKGECVGMLGIRDLMKSISESLEKENNGLARKIA